MRGMKPDRSLAIPTLAGTGGCHQHRSVGCFRSKYEQRLPETISGAEILTLGSIHPDPFTTVRPEVNYRVRACTRYAIEENQRIELFIELVRGTTQQSSLPAFRQMGELMFQSHWSYTETGLGCEGDEPVDWDC